MKKENYETPAVKIQQVMLEQVIASSNVNGGGTHENMSGGGSYSGGFLAGEGGTHEGMTNGGNYSGGFE